MVTYVMSVLQRLELRLGVWSLDQFLEYYINNSFLPNKHNG